MSIFENVGPLLAARAARDPDAAKLLKMFTKAERMLNESSLARMGEVEVSRLSVASDGRGQRDTMATDLCQKCQQAHPGRLCDYDHKGDCAETIASTKTANLPPGKPRDRHKERSN